MKKFATIAVIVLLVLGAAFYFMASKSTPAPTTPEAMTPPPASAPQPAAATTSFDSNDNLDQALQDLSAVQ